jgi:hypothetical protein
MLLTSPFLHPGMQLIITHLIKKFSIFVGPKDLLLFPQETAQVFIPKMMCPIQFQSHLDFLDLPNGIF